ncbi:uncharacterized protein LOC106007844 [Heterocephalus glaber]|uniref:Uncharacterized protein LOC106007844 n=1 Tax=Heterocephalus glaber TaxID=10181 RepID=A0AAX6S319_HETGA|nr:uncharacterized protein LOC106007844 [Heterocephalus glaber]XP_021104412.1 uncharacterized protein LOC106007844 [Heterocephalus glaber]
MIVSSSSRSCLQQRSMKDSRMRPENWFLVTMVNPPPMMILSTLLFLRPSPTGTSTQQKVRRGSGSIARLCREVSKGLLKSPAAFLERIQEAFCRYTPMDPEATETKAAVIMDFVNQVAPDIRRKLQKVDRLREKSIQDLGAVAERAYNNRETAEEKQVKADNHQTRNLARILLATTVGELRECERHLRKIVAEGQGKGEHRDRPRSGKNQCAYCKEEGHWARECPKKPGSCPKAPILAMDELSD